MKRKPYSAYKPSGVEWLADVPEHWDVKKLKFVFWLSRGVDLPSESFVEGPFPVYGSNGVIGHHNKYTTEGPCVVVGRSGSVGEVNYVEGCFWAHNTALYIQDFLGIITRFSYYLLLIIDLKSLSAGSAVGTLNRNYIHDVIIAVPQLPEQQAIADFLDRETGRIDTLLAKKKRLIELLREKRSALISHAVTKGLDPSVKLKPSGVEWLGDVPEHWEVKRCGTAYNIQLGKMLQPEASSTEDVPMHYFKALHVQWGKVTCEDLPTMWASFNDAKKYSVSNGDLLACEGGEVGRAAILKNYSENAIIQNSLHRVRSNGVNSLLYLMYVIIEAASRQWFEILCNKATIAHFTGEKFAALRVPFPPLREQETIATFLDHETEKIDALIAKVEDAITKLKEYRTALIGAAVTGKIDVREAA